jgi:cobalt-zinc-cadmium efflux system membrane fusion protein
MNTAQTEAAQHTNSEPTPLGALDHPEVHEREAAPRRRSSGKLWFLLFVLVLLGAGTIYVWEVGLERARTDAEWILAYVQQHSPTHTKDASAAESPGEATPAAPWDEIVRISLDDAKTIGLVVVSVHPQADPIRLPLMGRTDYDPNSLSKIRPRFDTLVEKVRVERGQKVTIGTPLVDLFSTELAAAKNDFQTAYVQWVHDQNLLKMKKRLRDEKAASEQVVIDAQNDESKSRLTAATAKEKLKVFGVAEEQIELLTKNLGNAPMPEELHTISDKARMTRLSPVEGSVIQRDAVPGNLYDNNDVLLTIAPLDHLFVWVNVYEADQAKVAVAQEIEIKFPYLDKTVLSKVDYIASEVSKDTRAILLRTSVPNIDGKLKADMLVRATLMIPPVAGQTEIPRQAMVVMNGAEYAFVQKAEQADARIQQFERRPLVVAEERDDHVVVQRGLKPGEHVASNGALVLAQLYEDQQMIATGMPLK